MFTHSDIVSDLNAWKEMVEEAILNKLHLNGLKFVNDARSMSKADGGFGDVSGNLRSSIGYFILKDGEIVEENLSGNEEGKNAARKVLDDVEKKDGFQLIGMAGMNYASIVESKGYNVISVQADVALINLDKDLFKLAAKLQPLGVSFQDTSD